mmetsp:Transcript_24949/g.57943  ORF Transcript_24949/g.57943 Transcript_24949/m.57943 type:complete len:201 (+) Transcript_24949:1077-1679(+)
MYRSMYSMQKISNRKTVSILFSLYHCGGILHARITIVGRSSKSRPVKYMIPCCMSSKTCLSVTGPFSKNVARHFCVSSRSLKAFFSSPLALLMYLVAMVVSDGKKALLAASFLKTRRPCNSFCSNSRLQWIFLSLSPFLKVCTTTSPSGVYDKTSCGKENGAIFSSATTKDFTSGTVLNPFRVLIVMALSTMAGQLNVGA